MVAVIPYEGERGRGRLVRNLAEMLAVPASIVAWLILGFRLASALGWKSASSSGGNYGAHVEAEFAGLLAIALVLAVPLVYIGFRLFHSRAKSLLGLQAVLALVATLGALLAAR
jgi:hypothetical protein